MFLALSDLSVLFKDHLGVQDELLFYTVTDQANVIQPKGLFVSVNEGTEDLAEAMANGAIAAIWERGKKLPHYTPNQFPVFFTSDSVEAIKKLLQHYLEKLNGEIEETMEITNFKFSNKELLNKNRETYDIAVMLKKLTKQHVIDSEGRE
ncbi:hypothetical protein [Neobacillus bataviensis]|uniref:hypothetical protein n=1 Tax=Neobacillus bataviensis TaxID=220685 RepID=UPI001CC056DC|nr:hypothetical protein [Neobacillus bataviensis]